jgi:hypothetical protein
LRHFIEWDELEVRIDGERLNAIAATMRVPPIERIGLRFLNGLLRIEGTIRKFIAVPFTVEVTELRPSGTTVRVPLKGATAAGFPLPLLLFRLFREKLPKDLVTFEEPATLVVSLDRFLPPFVSADIQRIWIIAGGLAVQLGHGGADLPPPQVEASDGTDSGGGLRVHERHP